MMADSSDEQFVADYSYDGNRDNSNNDGKVEVETYCASQAVNEIGSKHVEGSVREVDYTSDSEYEGETHGKQGIHPARDKPVYYDILCHKLTSPEV
jgi:hypothetical protein